MPVSKPSNISTLDQLRERKLRLELEEREARRGLSDTLANTPRAAKEYAVEDLALPAMGIGLAAYVAYRFLRSDKREEPTEKVVYVREPYDAERADREQREAVRSRQQLHTSHTVYPDPQPAPNPQPTIRKEPRVQAAYSAPQPASTLKQRTGGSAFDWGKLLAAGKLLVPAVQAITTVVMNQRTHEEVQETQQEVREANL